MPYWSNPPFLIFDIRALWRSGLSARASECQKLKWWVRPVWQSVSLNRIGGERVKPSVGCGYVAAAAAAAVDASAATDDDKLRRLNVSAGASKSRRRLAEFCRINAVF